MKSFPELDRLRSEHGLTRKQVYERAGLDKGIWARLTRNPTNCRVETLRCIETAIDLLIKAKKAKEAA